MNDPPIYSLTFLVGFDREIFSGNPSLKDLDKYTVKLSPEEKGTFYESDDLETHGRVVSIRSLHSVKTLNIT